MITTVFEGLRPEQQRELLYAFEHGIEAHIMLRQGFFIGVNITGSKTFEILEEEGSFAYGRLNV
jgi:hypothetical protein